MITYTLSPDSSAEDLAPIARCLHELLNHLPTTARSLHRRGVRIEDNRIVDREYSGPVLEQVLASNTVTRTRPSSGPYRGVPVIVAPLRNEQGEVMGAIGVVDITGIFDLATLMEHQSMILKQVCGKDPCPLPQEQVGGKR